MRTARIRCGLMTLAVWKGVFAVADVAEGWVSSLRPARVQSVVASGLNWSPVDKIRSDHEVSDKIRYDSSLLSIFHDLTMWMMLCSKCN